MFGARTNGIYQQQDAQEFLSYLLNALSAVFPTHHKSLDSNLVKDLFQITYRCSYECPESGETLETEETSDTLYCNIRGGPQRRRKGEFHVPGGRFIPRFPQGIQLGLESSVEKHSETLGRSASWKKHMKISRLPKYLCVEVGVSLSERFSSCGSTGRRYRIRKTAEWHAKSCERWSFRSVSTCENTARGSYSGR